MDWREAEGYRTKQFEAINEYRRRHGVPPLARDQNVARNAQAWADHLATIGRMEHSNSHYGENLASGYSLSNVNCANLWYAKISQTDFYNLEASRASWHLTQILWRGSKKIGIGISKSRAQVYYVVANFDPAGNVMGCFAENVPPPL